MTVVDFLLNLAALLIWFKWHSIIKKAPPHPLSLAAALKPAEPVRRPHWIILICIPAIIVVRAFFYWHFGQLVEWKPRLNLAVIVIPFQTESFYQMFWFSMLSFLIFSGICYFWLCFLSAINVNEINDIYHRAIKFHLGKIGLMPVAIQLLFPFVVVFILWTMVSWILVRYGLLAPVSSTSKVLIQGLIISAGLILSLKHLLIAISFLYLVYSYVYLGMNPFWSYVNITGRRLLKPLRFLRLGRIDLSPIAMIVLVWWLSELGSVWLPIFYQRALM